MSTRLDPSAFLRPHLERGRRLADEGDLHAAEHLFRSLCLNPALEGPDDRSIVLGSLMTIYARLERLYEALVLARLLGDRFVAEGRIEAAAGCMATYCEALTDVANADMRARRLRELARLLARLPTDAGRMAREAYHGCAFDQAIVRADRATARHHAERFREYASAGGSRPWRAPLRAALMDARLDLLAGVPRRALGTLRHAQAGVANAPTSWAPLTWMLIRCYETAGQTGRAASTASDFLEHLEALQRKPGHAPRQLRHAARLAAWFDRRVGQERAARRAYDLAAAAVLERMGELDAALAGLPELGVEVSAAAEDLAHLRRGFVGAQGALLSRVAELFRRRPEAAAPFLLREEPDVALLHICAWCERLRTPGGRWLPIGHFIPRDGPHPITHGICEDCLGREGRT